MSPLVRRILADNPSPFTYQGTQTFIVGRDEVAVIDPGPDLAEHVEAVLAAVAGERVTAILCTHTHRDHSPASRALRGATGAPILGCAPLSFEDRGPRADAAFDRDYVPDRVLRDGETIDVGSWSLEAVATPGHTSNHLCFALAEEKALFTGDHVMGWSTTVVSPPDGDMTAYMASLRKLQQRDDTIYHPAHGPPVEKPQQMLRGLILHRRQREAQIVAELERGEGRVEAMVTRLYSGLDPRLRLAAARSVLAHLIDLEGRGRARREGDLWRMT